MIGAIPSRKLPKGNTKSRIKRQNLTPHIGPGLADVVLGDAGITSYENRPLVGHTREDGGT